MKGRRLPLGGTSRSRRSDSDADQPHPPLESTPAGRTRQRGSPNPADSSPPDKSKEVGHSKSKSSNKKTGSETPPRASRTSSANRGSPMQTQDTTITPPRSNKKAPETTSPRPRSSSKTGNEEGVRRNPSRRRSVDTSSTRMETETPDSPKRSAQGDNSERNPSNGSGKPKRSHVQGEVPPLVAYEANRDTVVRVKLIVGGSQFVPPKPSSGIPLGFDGNLYYCFVCHGFGDVVCCDGCPRVFHRNCIPLEDPARKSLEDDVDPWYCPECLKKKTNKAEPKTRHSRSAKSDRRTTSQNRCVDCHQEIDGVTAEPCSECGNYTHNPSCLGDIGSSPSVLVLCGTCRAVDDLTKEEDDMHEVSDRTLGRRADAGGMDNGENDDGDGKTRRKRSRAGSVSTDRQNEDKGRKRKKKRKKLEQGQGQDANAERGAAEKEAEVDALLQRGVGPVEAIPGFYFYLAENRWKIERILARKHRYFNRLPKGNERNELVAREAALWWVKLRPTDHRRYMTMSMRDFEIRIIEWKEEKNLRDMLTDEPGHEDVQASGPVTEVLPAEDERRAFERHEKRFHSTSVGSKPFRPEPGHSYNRVLLDLLHDMRFHPCPLVAVKRPEAFVSNEEHVSKATIPYFEVHGPVSTSVGDECLGCSRGWKHFCTVLRRQMPSIEHRAKLQPPLSSLMATRVGLGLRQRLEHEESESDPEEPADSGKQKSLQTLQKSTEAYEILRLPVVPSSTLGDVSSRVDDIVHVIEETTAMRVPEPSRPPEPEKGHSSKGSSNRSLPLQRTKEDVTEAAHDDTGLYRCGRCRTVSDSEMGCIQCRRAQLVINLTKKSPHMSDGSHGSAKTDGKALRVQTVMLGRVQTKEGSGDNPPSEGEIAVSNAILKQRWAPMAVLAPDDTNAPPRKRFPRVNHEKKEDAMEDEEEEREEEDNEDEGSAMDVDIVDDNKNPDGAEETETPEDPPKQDPPKQDPPKQDPPKQSSDRYRVRQKPTRLTVTSASTKDYDGERSKQVKKASSKAEELSIRSVTIACYGIFLAMLRRDPLKLFSRPMTGEDYLESVKVPMDFSIIRENVLAKQYVTVDDLVADFRLLCDNSMGFYPTQSVYWKTAKEISENLEVAKTNANEWIRIINDAYANHLERKEAREPNNTTHQMEDRESAGSPAEDPFRELRAEWPGAVKMLENGHTLRDQVESDFVRTKENETAYYGTLAIRRAAAAVSSSLAPYTDSGGEYGVVVKRDHKDDEKLRDKIDEDVAKLNDPIQLAEVSSWREESVVRLLRAVQSRRMERRSIPESGCSRCIDFEGIAGHLLDDEMFNPEKKRKRDEDGHSRVNTSRAIMSTGLGSAKTCQRIVQRQEGAEDASLACVSVRTSKIHGMGVFADQPFKKGDVVAEYVGEYIDEKEVGRREKKYRDERRQEFMFRLTDKLTIDATVKGGAARFINHNCEPNCYSNIVPGKAPNEDHQRVMIVALRNIDIKEEITYDYRIPLEGDLDARIPCNCQTETCRGFMNWDLPETGSNNRALLVHKRGANMRDRIRRLRRPLKRDEV